MGRLYRGPIKLALFDVDGVLTDGSLHIDGEGERVKTFNVRDGLAISLLRAHGIRSGILSGKASAALEFRIRQLKFDFSITGQLEKRDAYFSIKAQQNLQNDQIVYVGDDVVDLPLAGLVRCFYAPADAHTLVLKNANHILATKGGHGVAREVAEHILLSDGITLEEMYLPLTDQWNRYDAAQ